MILMFTKHQALILQAKTSSKRFFWSLKCAPHCQCRPSGSSYSSLRMSMYVGHQRAVWVDISTDVCVSITD